MENFVFYTFIMIGFMYFAHIAVFAIGGNIYDVKSLRQSKKHKQWKIKRFRPTVSVLIPAYNEEAVIERCLQSVFNNRYKKLEIIVISDNSTDNTNRIVRNFISRYLQKNIRLIARKNNWGKAMGLNYALKRYASGELVMTLDADSVLERNALKNAVKYFMDEDMHGIAANVRIIPERISLLNRLQLFEYMVSYRTKKFYSLTNSEFIIGGVGSVYRREIMKQFGYYDSLSATEDIGLSMKIASSGGKRYKLHYASDVIAYTEAVSKIGQLFKQRYRWKYGNLQNLFRFTNNFIANRSEQSAVMLYYRLPMAYVSEILLLMEPLLITYAIILTILAGSLAVFVSAYVLLCAYTAFVLWADENMSIRVKLRLSVDIPMLYFLFYIMSFIQIVAAVRCIITLPKMFEEHHSNTWVSPKRLGKNFLAN